MIDDTWGYETWECSACGSGCILRIYMPDPQGPPHLYRKCMPINCPAQFDAQWKLTGRDAE